MATQQKGGVRKYYRMEEREMIVRVYQFLRDEYKFMRLYNADKCNLKPLSSVMTRAANATGVSPSFVSCLTTAYKHILSTSSCNPQSKENEQNIIKKYTYQTENMTNQVDNNEIVTVKEEDSSEEDETILGKVEVLDKITVNHKQESLSSMDEKNFEEGFGDVGLLPVTNNYIELSDSSDDNEPLVEIKRKRKI